MAAIWEGTNLHKRSAEGWEAAHVAEWPRPLTNPGCLHHKDAARDRTWDACSECDLASGERKDSSCVSRTAAISEARSHPISTEEMQNFSSPQLGRSGPEQSGPEKETSSDDSQKSPGQLRLVQSAMRRTRGTA